MPAPAPLPSAPQPGPPPPPGPSPLRLLLLVAGSVFLAEVVVMPLFWLLPPSSPPLEVLVDSILLVLLVAPALYFFSYRPLLRHIARRRQAETALRASEETYRSLFEHSNDAVFIIDPASRRFLGVNQKAARQLGYAPQELLNLTIEDIDAPPAAANNPAILQELKANGIIFEHAHRRKDGTEFPVEISSRLIRYGGQEVIQSCVRDISARKQAEAALRRSETHFRSTAHAAPDAIITVAADGSITFWNRAAEAIFGYTAAEAVGRPVTLIIPERLHNAHREGLQRVVQTGESGLAGQTVEMQARHKQGAEFPIELSLAHWQIDGESFFAGVVRDITARREAEAKIQRRNRELVLLNRVVAAAAAALEPDEVLEIACRELGRAFDLPFANATMLNPAKTEAQVVAEYRAAGERKFLHAAIPVAGNPLARHLMANRGPLVVEDVAADPRAASLRPFLRRGGVASLIFLPLLVNDDVVGSLNLGDTQPRSFSAQAVNLAWSVADAVASALARAQLTQAHRRLNAAIEQAAESVIITNPAGDIEYVNPAFERISGYSRAEVMGQNPRLLKSGKQDTAFYRQLWQTITAGEVWRGQFVNKRKDGALFTEEATITPVYNDAGDIINYVAVKRDITHELLLEEQYRQAQKMDALGRLTGGIAHDFNNSLTAINGFAELLKTRLPSGSPQARLAENIFNAGQRAADLTRQLLIFSRKDVIAPQIVNLNQTVAAAQTMLERIIGEDIQLETELVPDVWAVSANPGQVEQVIMNLVVNARQAMPDGGYLTIETANMVLDEAYAARHLDVSPGEYALLAVSDTGVGMTQAVQARIFEPFFTTKEKEMGTGLGLATVFGIVKQSGGHIWVYSEVGKGSTFKIYLPHFTGEIAGPAGHNRLEAIPRGSETILMAEDDPQVRTLVAQILGGQGYTVLEAASGEDALAVAQAHRGEIHLALADVVLPNMSGKTLVEALRGTLPALKVLYMSGYTLNGVEHQGIEASEENYLPKPFTPAILTQKVRAALNAND